MKVYDSVYTAEVALHMRALGGVWMDNIQERIVRFGIRHPFGFKDLGRRAALSGTSIKNAPPCALRG